jgi:hypothetical protein
VYPTLDPEMSASFLSARADKLVSHLESEGVELVAWGESALRYYTVPLILHVCGWLGLSLL